MAQDILSNEESKDLDLEIIFKLYPKNRSGIYLKDSYDEIFSVIKGFKYDNFKEALNFLFTHNHEKLINDLKNKLKDLIIINEQQESQSALFGDKKKKRKKIGTIEKIKK
ncbi:MAG: hypothetical protein ACOCUI_03495 [bacterium]